MSEPAGKLAVREATPADHAACADILGRAWNSSLPTRPRLVGIDEFREQTRGELLLVAVRGHTVAGFISVWEPDWFIHHLFVEPAFQGSGIGRRLVEHVSAQASDRELSLKCQVDNAAAIRFYERNGFRCTASRGVGDFGEWVELRQHSSGQGRVGPAGKSGGL